MSNEAKPCSQCAGNCRRETARTSEGAFVRYSQLVALGHLPTLCQQADGVFNVCYADDTAGAQPLACADGAVA